MLTRRAAVAALSGAAALPCLAQGDSSVIEVPSRIGRNGQLQIRVRLAGARGEGSPWCLLDTGGGPLVYLTRENAAAYGVIADSSGHSAGPLDAAAQADLRAHITLEAGGVEFRNQEVLIKKLQTTSDDGIVGAAVFARYVIELDFRAPSLRLHPPQSFRYAGPGRAVPFELQFQNPRVVASLSIDGGDPVPARMTVDTGAARCAALLTPRFSEELARRGRALPWKPAGNGFSTCHIPRIAVGESSMDEPLLVLPPVQGFGSSAVGAPDGMLALEFLNRYRIFLNYAKAQMILDPNAPNGLRN